MRNISDIVELSTYVNHLMCLHVQEGGLSQIHLDGQVIDMKELRRSLKWQGFFIKKLQTENRSVYYVNRGDRDVIFGRTQSLVRDYHTMVDMAMRASSATIKMSENLIGTLRNLD
ncbi:hypothetical protein HOO68_02110 [Candidatus Gracilibacteria bacterium]|nr:hypothetical protein [Candidatus Gracilibacteria bacterium]